MDEPHMSKSPTLAIVIPCYNEEDVLPETRRQTVILIRGLVEAGKISRDSTIYFVDDGSRDRTWPLIEQFSIEGPHVAGIKLSRNRGHQNALLAGLFTAEGDAVVSIDADLQDDICAITEMVDRFLAGAEIVYGVRRMRDSDSPFKRVTAELFYRLIDALGAESIHNHADYRLMSRRAVETLKQYREVNIYLRGIVPLLGFRSAIVHYDRAQRFAGKSKYPLRKMVALALEAVTSFSVVPLRLITLIGFLVFVGTTIVSLWALWVRLFSNSAVPGWTSIVLPVYFLGGIQIFCIGMLGEYLGKAYAEVKARPRYLIEKTVSAHTNKALPVAKVKSEVEISETVVYPR
ncbi:MAG: glycosyltransferase family 2 protein [Acetobacteraceae bacterium]